MIQKLIEKLNKKRLKERISSAIVMVALIVSISGVVGAVSGIIVSNRYNYALKNYGFSQGDIGKMMITFADTRSYLRATIGYQDENLVNSCAENYEKKKESCQQYTKEVKNTVSSADEEKIYNSITEKLNDYFDTCDAVLEKGKNTQDIDARHEAQQMAYDQVAPMDLYRRKIMKYDRPIIALDFPDKEKTFEFLKKFPEDEKLFVKVGMELFYSEGSDMVKELISEGHDVFLDLKLHDIPNTVKQAMKVIGKLGVKLTTVHISGGSEMLIAAKEGLLDGANGDTNTKILGITQLTSTDEEMVKNEQKLSISLKESVENYAKIAQKSGLDGVVCSAEESDMIYKLTGDDFLRITPGIRLAGGDVGDQKRVMTPDAAARNHSSGIVVGRAITKAANPLDSYRLVTKLWRGK